MTLAPAPAPAAPPAALPVAKAIIVPMTTAATTVPAAMNYTATIIPVTPLFVIVTAFYAF